MSLDGTPFQRAVWAFLLTIPYGRTYTYGEVAAALGKPGAARAVGAAVGRNPISIAVPCHRVVGRGRRTGRIRRRPGYEAVFAAVGGNSSLTESDARVRSGRARRPQPPARAVQDEWAAVDEIERHNQRRVLAAFQAERVGEEHFAGSTGYGANDIGRETLETAVCPGVRRRGRAGAAAESRRVPTPSARVCSACCGPATTCCPRPDRRTRRCSK